MRVNLRFKIGNITLFAMISSTQTLKGITSKLENGNHIILMDLEKYTNPNATYEDIRKDLMRIQIKYLLPTIFITTDKPNFSWHAFCFQEITIRQLMIILNECNYVDWNFIYWTMVRGEATIRVNNKFGRETQKLFDIIESDIPYIIPKGDKFKVVDYDTGIEKKGLVVNFINGKLEIR